LSLRRLSGFSSVVRSVQARLACVMFAASPRARASSALRLRTRLRARSCAGHNRSASGKRGQAHVRSYRTLSQIPMPGFVEALLPNSSFKRTAAGQLR